MRGGGFHRHPSHNTQPTGTGKEGKEKKRNKLFSSIYCFVFIPFTPSTLLGILFTFCSIYLCRIHFPWGKSKARKGNRVRR